MNISNTSINKINAVSIPKISGTYLANEPPVSQTDSLNVSQRAMDVSKALNAVKAAPDIREDKVAQAVSKLKDGIIQVPSSQIAQSLLGALGGGQE